MATQTPVLFVPLDEWLTDSGLPLPGVVTDRLADLYVSPTRIGAGSSDSTVFTLRLAREFALRLPGVDFLAIAFGDMGVEIDVSVGLSPFELKLTTPIILRVDADVLRPLKSGTDAPDLAAETLDIPVASVELKLDGNGDLSVDLTGAASIPRCTIGQTGVILDIGKIRWLTPSSANKPTQTPTGFTGLYMDDVFVQIPQLPAAVNSLRMDDVFLGTDGFSGKVTKPGLALTWDDVHKEFTGDVAGELFGFKGGLSSVALEFEQNALVGCDITGDVFVPYLDKRVGLTLGLDGAGSVTATAGLPTSQPPEQGVSAAAGYLLHLEVGSFLELDVDSLRFEALAGKDPTLEISGRVDLDVPGLDLAPVDLNKLRIGADGSVAIDGGWIDIESGKSARFNGFPLELTRIGFGAEDDGHRWIGLNGGLKLSDKLPLGVSVEGMRISWDPSASNVAGSVSVSLKGIALELTVPGAFHFAGEVSFFDEVQRGTGFAGHVDLDLIALKVSVEADLVIARVGSYTYFYLYLSADLPSGIPLPGGIAIYGFQGLVGTNLAPDRSASESWYYGWYKRAPIGVTSFKKWRPERGSWAVGVGVVLGTAPDSGFSMNAKVLLLVVGPGPQLLLVGKGNFLKERTSSTDHSKEGAFDALLVFDAPGKSFQANLAAEYKTSRSLLELAGSVDVGFSWAKPKPADLWHVYLGEKSPEERRWRAELFDVFTANAWFQIWQKRLNLGGWVGFGGDWKYGPLHAWVRASIDGEVDVNLDPHQFDGILRLVGEGGVKVFKFGFEIAAWAAVEVKTPTPRYVSLAIHVSIKIDLWLFEYEYEGDLALRWGDKTPPPTPVSPVLDRVAVEHMKVDEARDLVKVGQAGVAVPPDGRPVLMFKRPVRDLGEIGAPTNPSLPSPDVVPPAKFSYQLAHVALHKGSTVIAAAGLAHVQGATLSISGSPTLPGAIGADVEIAGAPGKRFTVTAGGSGSLTVTSPTSDPIPTGLRTYRLTAKPPQAKIVIVSAAPGVLGTVQVTLAADPNIPPKALAGGILTAVGGAWTIEGNNGTTITVRGPDLPPTGTAVVTGPAAPSLDGSWLPVSDEVPTAQNSLMIGSRTPFAWFRHNDPKTLQAFDVNDPSYGCGPTARERVICGTFDSLSLGPLGGPFQTAMLYGMATGVAAVVGAGRGRSILLGGVKSRFDGAAVFKFDPPVEAVSLSFSAGTTGTVTANRNQKQVDTRHVNKGDTSVDLSGDIDEVGLTSRFLTLKKVCFSPEWRCLLFEPSAFPQGSTGRQSYAGMTIESTGVMTVEGRELVSRVARERAGQSTAVCMIHLPARTSRVRVKLGAAASVTAYAGFMPVGSTFGEAGDELVIHPRGWLDRIHIVGQPDFRIKRVCYAVGEPGWSDQELTDWQASVARSLEALYKQEPVLAPDTYRLEVVAGVDNEPDWAPATWTTSSYVMEVGNPPGLIAKTGDAYPDGGALRDLSLYVDRTVPEAGGRPHYRADDVALSFNVTYLSQMFLTAGAPLRVGVTDSNEVDLRSSGINLWGRDPELALSVVEEEWMKALHGNGSNACAKIDPSRIPHDEMVLSSGPLLAESELHTASLTANGQVLFAFDFVSSKYASFVEHLCTFAGRCRSVAATNPGTSQVVASKTAVDSATAALGNALTGWTKARQAASQPGATRNTIDAYSAARKGVSGARSAVANARSSAFAAIQASYGTPLPGREPLPRNLEVTRLPNALLIESPEPLHFPRVTVTSSRSSKLPLRRRVITFSSAEFGAPDVGTFAYRGSEWKTNNELRVVDGAVEPRKSPPGPGPWKLMLSTPKARTVEMVLKVSQGGSATVTATPVTGSVKTFPVAGSAGGSPVTITASWPKTTVASIGLTGAGVAIESVTIVDPFVPVPPQGDVRLAVARLPASAADDSHSVDLISFRDVDLDGWSVRWIDALSPGDPVDYYTFPAGSSLAQGRVGRVFGGLTQGPSTDTVDPYFGGAAGGPALNGAVIQLVDPAGNVTHELAVLKPSLYNKMPNMLIAPDADGTRAFLVSMQPALPKGHWRIDFAFARDAGPGLPVLSRGGETSAESAALYFTVE